MMYFIKVMKVINGINIINVTKFKKVMYQMEELSFMKVN